MLRWLTAGESHGPALVGDPRGSARRRRRHDRRRRPRPCAPPPRRRPRRADEVRAGRGAHPRRRPPRATLGGPVAIEVGNSEWPKWETVMSPDPVDPSELEGVARNAPLTRPRPGHADLVGMQKYGFDDARPVLERASARETAARVALGAVAKAFLRAERRGDRALARRRARRGRSPRQGWSRRPTTSTAIDADPARCLDPHASAAMEAEIEAARKRRRHARRRRRGGRPRPAAGPRQPRALGPPARRAARRRAHGHPGDQGRRGRRRVRAGPHAAARRRTTRSCPAPTACVRASGRSGGTEGGMSTGEVLRVRAAMKPISTDPARAAHGRRRDRRAGPGHQPALRRVRGAGGRRRRRGDGRAGARRRRAGEVRRRLGGRDRAQRGGATATRSWCQ